MGGLFSRFSKAKRTSKEILEDLEKRIGELSAKRRRSQQVENSFIGYLIILSFIIYLIGLLFFYKYYFPTTGLEWLLYSVPLILFPLVVYFVKKLLNMYFMHRKSQYDLKLQTLHEEKRHAINEVMEREPYRVARELLERFDPSNPQLRNTQGTPQQQQQQQRRLTNQTPAPGTEVRQRRQPQTPHPALMHRPVVMATPQRRTRGPPVTMAIPAASVTTSQSATSEQQNQSTPSARDPGDGPTSQQFIPPGMCLGVAPGPPTPCPILPQNRSKMDKMVEYLVGDGPNNRYALICSQCHSHNGMALRDEFEYLSFRCAYCYHLNPSRKKKPALEAVGGVSSTHPAAKRDRANSNSSKDDANSQQDASGAAPGGHQLEATPTSHPAGRRRHSNKTSERLRSQSSEDSRETTDK